MATDRRIHAAGEMRSGAAGEHAPVERFAHPVQPLEFVRVVAQARRARADPRDRVRVVRREHRIDAASGLEQRARAGQVADVRVRLAREHRVAGQALHLRALDLGVPVSALDETHRNARAQFARERHDVADHRARALLVRLHGKSQAVPIGQCRVAAHAREKLERQFESLGFLGVDRHADPMRTRVARKRRHDRDQLGEDARALRQLVARMQRGQLHRDRGSREYRRFGSVRAGADRRDRMPIRIVVARGIGGGDRRFAQHVVRMAIRGLPGGAALCDGLLDRAPQHELLGHHLHRLPHGEPHDRLAGARDEALVPGARIARIVAVDARQPAGQHQAPRRRVDQQRIGGAEVVFPVAARELVADQRVGGGRIRNPQQRLGDAHQQHAFGCGQVVLLQERFDAALRRPIVAHRFDPCARLRADGTRRRVVLRHLRRERYERRALVGEIRVANGMALGAFGNQSRRIVAGIHRRHRCTLAAWMMRRVQLLQPLARDVRVDRRRRDVGVPEQQLHDAKIGAVVQQMRCERMAQYMGRQRRLRNAGAHGIALDERPECLARQRRMPPA